MDMFFQWLEERPFINFPNYFWILCGFLVLVILIIVFLGLIIGKKNKKIKSFQLVLAAEKKAMEKTLSSEREEMQNAFDAEKKKLEASSAGMIILNENERAELNNKLESLEKENNTLKKQVEEANASVASKDKELATMKCSLDSAKAKNIEDANEITSYKTTNSILSQSIDNLKTEISNKDDTIESLKDTIVQLERIKRKAAETEEDNKVLMRAVSLIMNTKDGKQQEMTLDEVKTVAATKRQPLKLKRPAVEDLEKMKRPDLMHLAKREGVERFARKKNEEIIRLIRENRAKKK